MLEHVFSTEERVSALFELHTRMLQMLAVHLFGISDEPVEEARACQYLMLQGLEETAIGEPDRSAARIQKLLIEPAEAIWSAIIEELEESDRPIPYRPTAYGYRIADRPHGGQQPHEPEGEPD